MQLPAEHRCERYEEELLTLAVAHMHVPLAPILRADGRHHGREDLEGRGAGREHILDFAAAVVQKALFRAGAVEIQSRHLSLPRIHARQIATFSLRGLSPPAHNRALSEPVAG